MLKLWNTKDTRNPETKARGYDKDPYGMSNLSRKGPTYDS